ncbi:glutathione S-transferase family protein [Roseomonas populi]|uniref:Glutathione S-transferase n=1 Tax=Roseomonas populi TaxID=3121582 RepID=A0ABT1XC32_9PROT|nr:glutathione S-transferase [Roseomonas pecuniae]MCR0985693.1 glutathione S-transferase [Roseomonas pecuniae]
MSTLTIWGRENSVNVQKVLWCCGELGLAYDRRDAGMKFGVVDTPEYRALNPNGRVPTLVDGDVVLWESHSILRYLALRQIEQEPEAASIYPEGAAARARVDRWLDWVLSTLQPAERALFWGMVRTRPENRDAAAIRVSAKASGEAWQVLDAHLAHGRPYVEGDHLTLADIALGAYARRWFGVEVEDRPNLARIERWYERLGQRPSFKDHVAPPLT